MEIIEDTNDIEKAIAKLRYDIRGAIIKTAVDARNEAEKLLENNSTKLRRRTGRFERLQKGVTLNLRQIVSDNSALVSVLGSSKDNTQALRLFTGSKEKPRTSSRGNRGVIPNLNPLTEVINKLRQTLNNNIQAKLK